MAAFDGVAQLLQQRRPWIGPLAFDCSIAEDHAVEIDLTDNPIESIPGLPGAITDHAVLRPRVLPMTVFVTNSPAIPLTGALVQPTRHVRLWRKLVELMRRVELVTVVTTLELYSSMVIVRVGAPRRRETTNALEISVVLRQVQFAAIPGAEALAGAASEIADAEQDVGVRAGIARRVAELAALL